MEKITFREVYSYAISLLAKRDYSLNVLLEKVRKRFPEVSEDTLKSLKEELLKSRYVNELESARRYFLRKMEKGWGKRKIALHLRRLGFPEDVIREVELTTSFDYSFISREVEKLSSRKKREQLKRFLLQRGFSFSEITYLLKDVK